MSAVPSPVADRQPHGAAGEREQGAVRRVLRDGRTAADLTVAEWNRVLPVFREHGLTARLAADLDAEGCMDRVPEAVSRHLLSAKAIAEGYAVKVGAELLFLESALEKSGIDAVLLKGGAYVAAGLGAGLGRLFNDIDILVPETRLADAEACLDANGWRTKSLDAYDEKYYRLWTHQVPPRVHLTRGSVVDLHHSIVPRTSRVRFPAAPLIESATPTRRWPHLSIPAPAYLFLHSAVHLFCEEETGTGLRDLSDLDRLARQFGTDPTFWRDVADHAERYDLHRPVFYAFSLLGRFFETPIPFSAKQRIRDGGLAASGVCRLFRQAVLPWPDDRARRRSRLARRLLFVRAHYLKMPWHILIPHLVRKSLVRTETPQ
jgi:hypothetical protein